MHRASRAQIIEVDPANLTAETAKLLQCLLHQLPDVPFIDALDSDAITPKIYTVKIPDSGVSGHAIIRQLCLTRSLIRFARSRSHDEYRYAVCDKKAFQQGGEGFIYASHGTIKIDVPTVGDFNIVYKTKTAGKSRVLKELIAFKGKPKSSVEERAVREGAFLRATGIFREKNPILSAVYDRAAILMRRVEGEELLEHFIRDAGKFDQLGDHIPGTGNIFTVDQRIDLTIMVGEALLGQVHSKGIIHRDIKAENIIVKLDADNNPVSAVFIDYGIAKWEGEEGIDEGIGTDDCIAPEILEGGKAVKKSDAYSFVLMLQEMPWQDLEDPRYDDLSEAHKDRIGAILACGTDADVSERFTVEDVVDEFVRIRTERKLEVVQCRDKKV